MYLRKFYKILELNKKNYAISYIFNGVSINDFLKIHILFAPKICLFLYHPVYTGNL